MVLTYGAYSRDDASQTARAATNVAAITSMFSATHLCLLLKTSACGGLASRIRSSHTK